MLLCFTPSQPSTEDRYATSFETAPQEWRPDCSLPTCHFKKLSVIINNSICLGLLPVSPKPRATPKFPSPGVHASSMQKGLARGNGGRLDGQQVALGCGALGTAVVGWMNNVAPTPSSLPRRVLPFHLGLASWACVHTGPLLRRILCLV